MIFCGSVYMIFNTYDDDAHPFGRDFAKCDLWNKIRIEHEEELWHKYSSRARNKRSYLNRPRKSGKQFLEDRILAQHNDTGQMGDLDDVIRSL